MRSHSNNMGLWRRKLVVKFKEKKKNGLKKKKKRMLINMRLWSHILLASSSLFTLSIPKLHLSFDPSFKHYVSHLVNFAECALTVCAGFSCMVDMCFSCIGLMHLPSCDMWCNQYIFTPALIVGIGLGYTFWRSRLYLKSWIVKNPVYLINWHC